MLAALYTFSLLEKQVVPATLQFQNESLERTRSTAKWGVGEPLRGREAVCLPKENEYICFPICLKRRERIKPVVLTAYNCRIIFHYFKPFKILVLEFCYRERETFQGCQNSTVRSIQPLDGSKEIAFEREKKSTSLLPS